MQRAELERITLAAPVNIALIKYWGKRDERLVLPTNDSLSASLDPGVICATTTAAAAPAPRYMRDRIWLNGEEQSFENLRLKSCLEEIRRRAAAEGSVNAEFLARKIHINSVNNFPTAAGLASSAAGYACLVSALAKLYKIQSETSSIARLGSGSACRSVYGGFVRWRAGTRPDGSDSVAEQIADAAHWPEMRVLVCVVNDSKKTKSSTVGMQGVVTSELFESRLAKLPAKVERLVEAIQRKDFQTFGEITMKDSNQFHAICLDTYPPCVYLNDTSHSIMRTIHAYNEVCGEVKVAYTCDAGPNVCLYLLEPEVGKMLSVLNNVFPSSEGKGLVTGLKAPEYCNDTEFLGKLPAEKQHEDCIKYFIYTKVGEGPMEVDKHLIDERGEPILGVS